MNTPTTIYNDYQSAREKYAACGVDTEAALDTLASLPVSLHCWQGDDVTGFEGSTGNAGSGCLATGNYPGKARNFEELAADLDTAAAMIPGSLRLNLHASYATDNASDTPRDELTSHHFASWLDWASDRGWGIDFNPTCFGHTLAASGFTLAHPDPEVRAFWVRHCIACRHIGADFGRRLAKACVTNLWAPDGYKDTPADRYGPRERLLDSLEKIYAEPVETALNIDTVESKLFGIGVESYTVGSHEFYLAFAARHQVGLCLDAGHFHPTESVADKISAVMLFIPHLLLHVSRGVRWDSDHVVILDDATREMLAEVAQCPARERIHVGMDFFDASINRIAAWVIGARTTKKGLLLGMLSPARQWRDAEAAGDLTSRLALMEDHRSLPWGTVWNEACRRANVPDDGRWLREVQHYEKRVLAGRDLLA